MTNTALNLAPHDDKNIVRSETAHFGVDPHILYQLIYQQAGSLSKALMELVMNEIDAKSDFVNITIHSDFRRIVVEGNGTGFKSYDEIMKLFRVFGFNHDTKEEQARGRDFGRYGLGRGQIFAFGKSHWKTNNFTLDVDLKNTQGKDSLPFDVAEYKTSQFDGCRIEIDLYEAMSTWERNSLEKDLKRVLKYARQPILLNDRQVNTPMQDMKWNASTETLSFKCAQAGVETGLEVYNKGVYVRNYGHSVFGVSGALTSTSEAFDVNMARNDVQQATCPLWKQIKPLISPYANKQRAKKLTDSDRVFIIQDLLAGNVDPEKIGSVGLFKNIMGRYFSIKQLSTHAADKLTVADSVPSSVGEFIHQQKMACVLSPAFIEHLGFDSLANMIEQLKVAIKTKHDEATESRHDYRIRNKYYELDVKLSSLRLVDFKALSDTVDDQHTMVEKKKWTPLEAAKMHGLSTLNRYAATLARQKERTLLIGISESSEGWTDGSTYICIQREIVRDAFKSGHNSVLYVLNLLLHEYCHTENSNHDHEHDDDFNQRFRDLIEDKGYKPFDWLNSTLEVYFRRRKKLELGQVDREVGYACAGLEHRFKSAAF